MFTLIIYIYIYIYIIFNKKISTFKIISQIG